MATQKKKGSPLKGMIEDAREMVNNLYRKNYDLYRAYLQDRALLTIEDSSDIPAMIASLRINAKRILTHDSRMYFIGKIFEKINKMKIPVERELKEKYIEAFSILHFTAKNVDFASNSYNLERDLKNVIEPFLIEKEYGLIEGNVISLEEALINKKLNLIDYNTTLAALDYISYSEEVYKLFGLFEVYNSLVNDFDFDSGRVNYQREIPHNETDVISGSDIKDLKKITDEFFEKTDLEMFNAEFRLNELKSGYKQASRGEVETNKRIAECGSLVKSLRVKYSYAARLKDYVDMLYMRFISANKSKKGPIGKAGDVALDVATMVKKSVRKVKPVQEKVYIGLLEFEVLQRICKAVPEASAIVNKYSKTAKELSEKAEKEYNLSKQMGEI